jgi:hypothetical protein
VTAFAGQDRSIAFVDLRSKVNSTINDALQRNSSPAMRRVASASDNTWDINGT